jgi:hypothetical protein
MALVGGAVLVRHHAHDLVALHLGLERAAHAAVRAGGDHAVLAWPSWITDVSVSVAVGQACTQAPHDTQSDSMNGWLVPAHTRLEAAAADRQRERALRLLAGAHAAVADDALGRVVREVRVRFVLGLRVRGDRRACRRHRVSHFAQAHHAGHVLQLAVAVGGQVRQSSGWSEM